jgi:hypothetical protein
VGEGVLVEEVGAEHGCFPFAAGFPDTHSLPRRTNAPNFPQNGVLTKFESPAHVFGADEILNTHPATNRVAA